MEQEHFSEDVRRFVLEETRKCVAYRKYIKSRGYAVDEEQLAGFEEEIRVEEENLGESELDVIDEHAVSELQLELALVDLDFDATKYTKATLLRRGYIRLTMQPDKNHQRPHFHIEFKTEHSASIRSRYVASACRLHAEEIRSARSKMGGTVPAIISGDVEESEKWGGRS